MYVATLGYACGRAGEKASAAEALNQVQSYSRDKYVSPLDLSIASLGAGDKDRALSYLERAADERVMRVTELNTATFDELRAEPRFAKIGERLGLPA